MGVHINATVGNNANNVFIGSGVNVPTRQLSEFAKYIGNYDIIFGGTYVKLSSDDKLFSSVSVYPDEEAYIVTIRNFLTKDYPDASDIFWNHTNEDIIEWIQDKPIARVLELDYSAVSFYLDDELDDFLYKKGITSKFFHKYNRD